MKAHTYALWKNYKLKEEEEVSQKSNYNLLQHKNIIQYINLNITFMDRIIFYQHDDKTQ